MIDADSVHPMPDEPDNPDPDAVFFDSTTTLKAIADFAWSRSTSRLAVLGCVLRRGIALIPPTVRLPAITGEPASLNFYTATAGRSGQGKDAADSVGFAAVNFFEVSQQGNLEQEARQAGGGSGEGLARIFKGRKGEPPVSAVHVIFNEVAKMGALIDRQGATLESELLAGYMGQRLGAQNNSKETTTAIEPHSYRLCLGVGVQPENGDFFLIREKNGFPQRFLWLPATDPWCPRPTREARTAPTRVDVTLPNFGARIVGVPDRVWDEVAEQRWRGLVDDPDVDPLDSHINLTRLKVAVGLALLHGGLDITEDYWLLAGHLMLRSRQTRDRMRTAVDARRRRENTAKATARAEAEVIVETKLADARADRVLRAIKRKLTGAGAATEAELHRYLDATLRDDFTAVFELLVDEGLLVCCGTTQKGTTVWGWKRD